MNDAKNTWAMIVGGSSGMGYAVAKQLLESNVSAFIVGKNITKLQHAAKELSQYGRVEPIRANLRCMVLFPSKKRFSLDREHFCGDVEWYR